MKNQKASRKKQTRSEYLNVLIRKAALTLDPQGRISVLAIKAGLNAETIRYSIRMGRFTAGSACAIETAVGRDILSKEALCPEKYAGN